MPRAGLPLTEDIVNISVLTVVALVAGSMSCSEEARPQTDAAADAAVGKDASGGKDTSGDGPAVADIGLPDRGPPDQGPKPDTSSVTVLTATNHAKGWGDKWCFTSGCHGQPPKGHTQSTVQSCAACHGGNGACDPNGSHSGRKTHSKSQSCISGACHMELHGFKKNADCAACHFAAAGLKSCGP